MLHSGIDLHKRDLVIATVDAAGAAVRDVRLRTSRAAVAAYFTALPGPHRAVVESTSNWCWLRDLLTGIGVDVRLGHSKYIKAISYAKVKTDAVDAATLTQRCAAASSTGGLNRRMLRSNAKPGSRPSIELVCDPEAGDAETGDGEDS